MKAYKIKIPNPNISWKVQKAAFRMGYDWDIGSGIFKHTKEPYLYLWKDGAMTYGSREKVFKESPSEEIHWQTFINLSYMRTITLENGKKVKISNESYEALSKAAQGNKRWTPEKGERYRYLNSDGVIFSAVWRDDNTDNNRWQIGNVYSTPEEADEACNIMRNRQQILDRIAELNEGWEPNWGNMEEAWHLFINYVTGEIDISLTRKYQIHPDKYYFKSREIGYQLIEEFGVDLKYLFE